MESQTFSMNRAFREAQESFGENAGLYAGLVLVFAIPSAIAELATKGGEGMVAFLVPLVVATLFGAVSEAAITLAVLRRVKGEVVGNDMLSAGLNYYAPIVVAFFLGTLAVALGFVLFILPGIIAMGLLFFAVPAIVEEGIGGVAGLEASFRIGAGQRMEIFLMAFLFIVVWLGVDGLLDYLLGAAPLLAAFATWFAGGVIGAFGTVLAVTGYAQLREIDGRPLPKDNTPQPG